MAFFDNIFSKKEKKRLVKPVREGARNVAERTQNSGVVPARSSDDILEKAKDQGVSEQRPVSSTGPSHADILRAPHATEKSTAAGEKGIYTFRVASGANKHMVAGAVASRYGVRVERVRMMVVPAKERRRGRQIGWTPGFKKAMVQLKQGQKIEIV